MNPKGTARQIAARALGKPLPAGAEVHHVNRNPKDNRPANLVICQDKAYHRLLHAKWRAIHKPKQPRGKTILVRDMNGDLWRQFKSHCYRQRLTIQEGLRKALFAQISADKMQHD